MEPVAPYGLVAAGGAGGILLVALGLARVPGERRRFLLATAAPYALWILIGQNLANTRHWLPLAPVFVLLAAEGLMSLSRPAVRAAAVATLIAAALPVYTTALKPASDGRALVAGVVARCGNCQAVYVGDSKRLFDRYAPRGFPAYRRIGMASVRLDLEAGGEARGEILVSEEVEGIRHFGTLVADLGRDFRLYRIDPATLR